MKRVGIFGGGQLAMMLAEAAPVLGLTVSVLAPDADDCPAAKTGAYLVRADYEDEAAALEFAKDCDVLTFEFENVPVRTLFRLQRAGHFIAPGPGVLELIQDRLTEKQFLRDCGIELASFVRIDKAEDLAAGLRVTGMPAVLKTRHFGYDGKGQSWIHEPGQAGPAFDLIHHHPAVLEAGIAFVRECSVICARNSSGDFVHFPVTQNQHKDGVLRASQHPAECSTQTANQAIRIARKIAEKLEYVGVLAVEFFETDDGQLLVNEIAPRVHNSGHWTQLGAKPDQFELHLRAITGMDLPKPDCAAAAKMINLIGDQINQAPSLQSDGWTVTGYGKGVVRPGRKMAHAVKIDHK
ncbi:MAG: 5-(carboxyamino)imidazole ribonucleotide synthase [Robiginitomaculum sp.]|nr:MAG: 5-(carboxyamino)imidazole ribonucleotide synthase [Robiginitomaculum sp.]